MRREPCVCGGELVAVGLRDIPWVVREHNRTVSHLDWRRRATPRRLRRYRLGSGRLAELERENGWRL